VSFFFALLSPKKQEELVAELSVDDWAEISRELARLSIDNGALFNRYLNLACLRLQHEAEREDTTRGGYLFLAVSNS